MVRYKGALRSLRPLPWSRTQALPSRTTSPSYSPASSETRASVLYSVASMIRSRCPLHRSDGGALRILHFVFREKSQERVVQPLHRNREDTLEPRQRGRHLQRGKCEKDRIAANPAFRLRIVLWRVRSR